MTIPFCGILLLAGLAFISCGKQLAAASALLACLVSVLLIGSGPVPLWLLAQTQDLKLRPVAWTHHNSIVLLGAGTVLARDAGAPRVPFFGYGRISSAAAAYSDCRRLSDDCKIVVSGGDPQRHGKTEASVYSDALSAMHVLTTDLILEDQSDNTWQNAAYSTPLVPEGRTLAIVTSGFQLKRALLYFTHFRDGVEPIAGDDLEVELSLVPSAINFLLTDLLLHEQIGIARYFLYNALGWNVARHSAGRS